MIIYETQFLPVQAQREAALADVEGSAAAAMAQEQRKVAAREQEIADLTLALAERTAEVRQVIRQGCWSVLMWVRAGQKRVLLKGCVAQDSRPCPVTHGV